MARSKAEIRRYKLERLVPRMRFIDLEACDGGPEAWPVEIGWAFIGTDLDVGRTGSLIRPDANWDEGLWSGYAEAVHGIPRTRLDSAPAAADVADMALADLSDPELVVISDSPGNDQPWLDRLLALRGAAGRVRIVSLGQALNGVTEQENLARMKVWLRENRSPHRAAEDAARLGRAVVECHLRPRPDEPSDDLAFRGP